MKTKKFYKNLINIGTGLALLANVYGCATTSNKPTTSYTNGIPTIQKQLTKQELEQVKKGASKSEILTESEKQTNTLIEKIHEKNRYLATELVKIPELKDGISTDEVRALEDIVNLYTDNAASMEKVFEQILGEGKPDTRKYCTPLRFLFWLAEENQISKDTRIGEELRSDSEKVYKQLLKEFYASAKNRISNLSFKETVDLLNSPSLVDIYERLSFTYEYYIGSRKQPTETFKTKKANCKDTSVFTVYCLKSAGYKAGMLWVDSKIPQGHIITYFKEGDKFFIMDNGTPQPKGILGPYNSLKDIPYKIRTELVN